jgi:hypothetical protein
VGRAAWSGSTICWGTSLRNERLLEEGAAIEGSVYRLTSGDGAVNECDLAVEEGAEDMAWELE